MLPLLQRVAVVRRMEKGQKEEEGQSEAGVCYRDSGTTAWKQGKRAAKDLGGWIRG